eukprot:1233655-Amphidinium_carterae.1
MHHAIISVPRWLISLGGLGFLCTTCLWGPWGTSTLEEGVQHYCPAQVSHRMSASREMHLATACKPERTCMGGQACAFPILWWLYNQASRYHNVLCSVPIGSQRPSNCCPFCFYLYVGLSVSNSTNWHRFNEGEYWFCTLSSPSHKGGELWVEDSQEKVPTPEGIGMDGVPSVLGTIHDCQEGWVKIPHGAKRSVFTILDGER